MTAAVRTLAPHVRTVMEIGGESSKYIALDRDPATGDLGIADFSTNGDCASGTGSFLDQQAARLRFTIEEVGQVALQAGRTAKIAGRCSVFAKSDMIHAQQKGFLPPEVLRGLCQTVARTYRSAVVRGREPRPPALLVGGVARNQMVVEELRRLFGLEDALEVPDHPAEFGAIGCALLESASGTHVAVTRSSLASLARAWDPGPTARAGAHPRPESASLQPPSEAVAVGASTPEPGGGLTEGHNSLRAAPLSTERVVCLRDRVHPVVLPARGPALEVAVGIDVGSVSTNVVLLDRAGRIVREIYTRTDARPVEVIKTALRELRDDVGERVIVRAVGTTGSGRELVGELTGADAIHDEITAHKTGASFIARTMLGVEVDTIFEIGGQDAKYIRIEDGVVVDFAMNEACAAGTGSFLEERAEELGVPIKNEFAARALASRAPIRLGERCTVFMERDVNAWMQRGASKDDLLAGLALSVATNYIHRVVRGRKISGTIFFQGGTAYNDAVAAAFSQILDREIIVPPYNGVVGAVGAALLAWDRMDRVGGRTRFRGWDLGQVRYQTREIACRACENRCDVQEFQVEGERSYWGDQCGDRFRTSRRTEFTPLLDDLVRLRREWTLDGYDPSPGRRGLVAFPRALYFHERFPYWQAFFRELGLGVILTPETNRELIQQGIEAAVAEPCFPIQIAHGHARAAAEHAKADFVFLPNMVNAEASHEAIESFYCPWGMTLPHVVKSSPVLEGHAGRIIHPILRFRGGREAIARALREPLRPYGIRAREISRALLAAEAAADRFAARVRNGGITAMRLLRESGEKAIVLVGRPYNLYDPAASLDVARKLRARFGVNVVPMEFLAASQDDLEAINSNLFWGYGRRIVAAARAAGAWDNLNIIYVTNFKCGPDSFIKPFARDAFGRPMLTLQFDGHANDAGMMTRVEAFLHSQGMLRGEDPPPTGRRRPGDRAVAAEAGTCEGTLAGGCATCVSAPLRRK